MDYVYNTGRNRATGATEINGGTMRFTVLILAILCLPVFSSCTGSGAEELFKTAEFEELQNNQEHAVQLYEKIITIYPENEFARKAEDRLEKLGKR